MITPLRMIVGLLFATLAGASPSWAAMASFSRDAGRPATPAEIADGVPPNVRVFGFFVTTDADILTFEDIHIVFCDPGQLYNVTPLGSDAEPPNPAFLPIFPRLGADSWITTPGTTILLGSGFADPPASAWADLSNDGPQTNFQFARIATTSTFIELHGQVNLLGPNTTVESHPFYLGFCPEPSGAGLAIVAAACLGLKRRRRR